MNYEAIKCLCSYPACTKWQVRGLAGEAKFTEKEAKAVAALLVKMERFPKWNCYCVTVELTQ